MVTTKSSCSRRHSEHPSLPLFFSNPLIDPRNSDRVLSREAREANCLLSKSTRKKKQGSLEGEERERQRGVACIMHNIMEVNVPQKTRSVAAPVMYSTASRDLSGPKVKHLRSYGLTTPSSEKLRPPQQARKNSFVFGKRRAILVSRFLDSPPCGTFLGYRSIRDYHLLLAREMAAEGLLASSLQFV